MYKQSVHLAWASEAALKAQATINLSSADQLSWSGTATGSSVRAAKSAALSASRDCPVVRPCRRHACQGLVVIRDSGRDGHVTFQASRPGSASGRTAAGFAEAPMLPSVPGLATGPSQSNSCKSQLLRAHGVWISRRENWKAMTLFAPLRTQLRSPNQAIRASAYD